MLLKDLITNLQELYDKETSGDYLEVFGEPEIMIDTFEKNYGNLFNYAGFDKEINIERSSDGVYLLLSRFKEDI